MSLLPWQDADWTRFADQFARLPHALLFTGAAGIGSYVRGLLGAPSPG